MSRAIITLRPLTRADLAAITHWFEDPDTRRQRLATSMIQALTRHPDVAAVELFEAGVDPENHGSRGALEAAGFRLQSAVPDCEAMLYCRAWTSHAATLAPIMIEVLYFRWMPQLREARHSPPATARARRHHRGN
jgi:hypothetical protein